MIKKEKCPSCKQILNSFYHHGYDCNDKDFKPPKDRTNEKAFLKWKKKNKKKFKKNGIDNK